MRAPEISRNPEAGLPTCAAIESQCRRKASLSSQERRTPERPKWGNLSRKVSGPAMGTALPANSQSKRLGIVETPNSA